MLLTELRKFRSEDGRVTKPTPQDPDPIPKSVKDAQEKLIDRTGSEEAAAALVRKVTAAQSGKEAEIIYEEIFRDYGEKIARAVRIVETAQRELWIGTGDIRANPDAAEVYKSAADAQKRLTIEMGNGIQIHQKAIDITRLWIQVLDKLSKKQHLYGLQIAKSAEAEVLQNAALRRFVQYGSEASEQAFNLTEQLRELTKTTASTSPSLATHSEHVGYVTEAYRELSAQIDDTIGDVLAGAVSFREAWESLGRGVLDRVKHLGRQLLDSLLGSVRDAGRQLSDVIFGQVHGTLGSFGLGASRGFLPSGLGGGSLGGFPIGLPTYPGGGGIFNGGFTGLGFPGTGGSLLWNAGAASVARVLPFTAPTLASYGFVVNPIGLGTGVGGGVPGVNAPPAAGFGPFSPAALGALGGLGGSYGGNALLGAFGYRPGLASTVGGFAGGIAGSFATPVLTALLGPALGPLAPIVGPLFGTFFGTALGGLFGLQPTRIDSEKRAIRAFFREEVPGYDYQRKESRNVTGLNLARAAGLDVGNAYLAASLPYVLATDNGGLGTVQRFHNIGVSGLGRSRATPQQARAAALRTAQRTGTHTTEGAIAALNRSLAGGFDRKSDPFTVGEVLENVWGHARARETRPTRDPVRLRDVVAGIIDIQTEFAAFVDSSRLAADILADETEQALTAAGRDASQFADVIASIRDGSTHAAEALREIGGLEFRDLTFTAEELDARLIRIKDDFEAIRGAATSAITTGLAERQSRASVESAFETGLQDALRQGLITRIVDRELGDLGSIFDDLDLTQPLESGSDLANTIKARVGSVYDQVTNALKAAGLYDPATPNPEDPDALAAAAAVRRGSQEQRLEAVGALAPGTANVNLLNTEIGTLRRDVGALALPSPDSSTEDLQTAIGLIDQLADKTVAYYQTAIAQQQRLSVAYTTVADSLDQRLQGLIGAPGGLTKTEQLATLQARAQGIREDLAGLTGADRAAAYDRLGANLEAQVRLGAYSQGDPRQRALFTRNTTEIEDLRMDADHHAKTAEQAIEDLQGAVVTELEQLHTLSDTYYQTAIGKFAEINESIRAYQPPTDLPEIEPPPAPKRNRAPEPQESAAARASSATGAPRISINVTLPQGGDAEDTAAYARAFVAELERQLQPGARGYELVHTITRESWAR